jgi:hypothetical protein
MTVCLGGGDIGDCFGNDREEKETFLSGKPPSCAWAMLAWSWSVGEYSVALSRRDSVGVGASAWVGCIGNCVVPESTLRSRGSEVRGSPGPGGGGGGGGSGIDCGSGEGGGIDCDGRGGSCAVFNFGDSMSSRDATGIEFGLIPPTEPLWKAV